MAGFVSPLLQIRFEPGEGADNLKILDPQGVPFATYVELVEQRDASAFAPMKPPDALSRKPNWPMTEAELR